MIISESKNFIFIHLEKCGGTSIEVALEPFLSWDDIIMGSTEFGTAVQVAHVKRSAKYGRYGEILTKHSTAYDIQKYLGEKYNTMYKFATVRNPIDLMTSLYFYSKKIVDLFLASEDIKDLVRWSVLNMPEHWKNSEVYLLNYVLSEIDNTGIDGFVRRMVSSKHSSSNPQIWRIDDSVELFDISNIGDRWDEILNKIGIEDYVPLEKANASKRDKTIAMSGKTRDIIKKHFKADYQWIPLRTGVEWND